jgi:hypothetical protein
MLLRRIRTHIRGENWFAVCVDFLVVVVGLFIGFQIDTWWEGRKEARLEGVYLIEIREDFDANKIRLKNSIAALEDIQGSMLALLEQSALPIPNLSANSLNQEFSKIQNMPTFMPISRAYINLTGSGDLKLIQNRDLKNALADYYATVQLSTLVQVTHERELVQIYEPYIIENLEYVFIAKGRTTDFELPTSHKKSGILELLGSRGFRNTVTQKWIITTDLLWQHHSLLERTEAITELLISISDVATSSTADES